MFLITQNIMFSGPLYIISKVNNIILESTRVCFFYTRKNRIAHPQYVGLLQLPLLPHESQLGPVFDSHDKQCSALCQSRYQCVPRCDLGDLAWVVFSGLYSIRFAQCCHWLVSKRPFKLRQDRRHPATGFPYWVYQFIPATVTVTIQKSERLIFFLFFGDSPRQ